MYRKWRNRYINCKQYKNCEMTLSDISYDALKIAQRNSVIVEGFGDSQKSNIRTIQSDLFEKIEENLMLLFQIHLIQKLKQYKSQTKKYKWNQNLRQTAEKMDQIYIEE